MTRSLNDLHPADWQAQEQAANTSVDTITLSSGGASAGGNATVNANVPICVA